ncbi:hypothetical protein R6Q57_008921 [Mikania cordata]
MLTDKDEMVKDIGPIVNLFLDGRPTKMMAVAGTPKLKFYDLDFGFGKPVKHESFRLQWIDIY